jgi:hypothetical protein
MSEIVRSVVVKHNVSVEECGVQNRICSPSYKSTTCEEEWSVFSANCRSRDIVLCRVNSVQ